VVDWVLVVFMTYQPLRGNRVVDWVLVVFMTYQPLRGNRVVDWAVMVVFMRLLRGLEGKRLSQRL